MPPLSAQDPDFNLLLTVGPKSKSVNVCFRKTPNGQNDHSVGPQWKPELLVTKKKKCLHNTLLPLPLPRASVRDFVIRFSISITLSYANREMLMLAANLQRRLNSPKSILKSSFIQLEWSSVALLSSIQQIAQQSCEISGPPHWANPIYGVYHVFVGRRKVPRKPTEPPCCEATALTTAPGSFRRITEFSVVSSTKILRVKCNWFGKQCFHNWSLKQ